MSEEEVPLKIFYPGMGFDIETPLQMTNFWENKEIEIYTMVNIDPECGKDDIEPKGMPMCMEKIKKVIKTKLIKDYDVLEFIEFEEAQVEDSSSLDEEECWVLKWTVNNRQYTLYYYEGLDVRDEYWPEKIDQINVFVHTNGPLDLEDDESDFIELLRERCINADVYAHLGMAKKFWPDAEDYYEFADEDDVNENDDETLYFLGDLKSYLP